MKFNRSNRLLRGLLITAAAVTPVMALTPIFDDVLVVGDSTVVGDSYVGGDSNVFGNANVSGTTLLNGTLTVQPAVTVIPGVPVVTPGPGTTSAIGGVVAGTGGNVVVTQTLLDTTQNSQVTTGAGGASIQTNGDTTLSASSTVTDTVNYGRAVTFEVAQAGNANPVGLAIPGTEIYYLTDPSGTPVPGAPTFATEALLDAYIATLTPSTMLALDPTLGTSVSAAGPGGNLQVDGNANVDGTLSVGAVPDVEAALGQNAADIATNTADIATNTADIATNTADIATNTTDIATNAADIAQEIADRTALIRQEADGIHIGPNSLITNEVGGVQQLFAKDAGLNPIDIDVTNGSDLLVNGVSVATDADVAAEAFARAAADLALQNNINAEAATRASEDTSIRNEFRAADVTLQNNINAEAFTRASEDASIRTEFRAADATLQNNINAEAFTRAAADSALSHRIDSNRTQIDKNTRGIAMVAAMTNTTIQPGMKQAIDFNLAQFDDATGFAFGYGYRVNENLQINAAGASTTDLDEAVARLGVSYQW